MSNQNPEIDFEKTPFKVNTESSAWHSEEAHRYAGISSFGLGGTNAHLVLEEAHPMKPSEGNRSYQLLILSARSSKALQSIIARLKDHLDQNRKINIARRCLHSSGWTKTIPIS